MCIDNSLFLSVGGCFMAARGWDAEVREERTWHENLGYIGRRSLVSQWRETFYRISKYSLRDEIRRDETLMVPFGNLSNTNLCMLVCILSASALCFSIICLKWCFCGNNLKLKWLRICLFQGLACVLQACQPPHPAVSYEI